MPQDPTGKTHQDVTQSTRGGLPGFRDVRHNYGTNAAKQIQGYEGPAKRGDLSSRESYKNASFDKSSYQNLGSNRDGQKLRNYATQPANKSNSKEVGDCNG